MLTVISIPTILFITLFIFIVLLFLLVLKQNKKISLIEQQQNELSLIVDGVKHNIQSIENVSAEQAMQNKNIQEISQQQKNITSTIKTSEHKLQLVDKELVSIKNELDLLSNQQPGDKLYSRALKLAALGADAEEISQNCEIPLAEAEMLLAVHHKTPR